MQLTRYKLGDLIVQRREKNEGYDVPIRGVSREGFIKPKQQEADTSIYNVFYRNDFVFNPARMELNSIALNLEFDKALCSSLYEIFYVKDESIVLPEFLNLHIKRDEFARHCEYIGSGSAREYCRVAQISEFDIDLPPIDVQQKIVDANRLLVKRIETNKKLIATLEQTAQTLYRHTFIDNIDPNNLPQGWRMGTLGEVCSVITKGTTPSTEGASFSDSGVNFIKCESITDDHTINKKMLSFIDAQTHQLLSRSIIREKDVVFTIAGTLGKFAWIDGSILPANTNQAIAIIRVDETKISPYYLMGVFMGGLHVDYCKRNVQQAVQANLSLGVLSAMPIMLAGEKETKEFTESSKIILEKITLKQKENQTLTQMQTLLLSKMGV